MNNENRKLSRKIERKIKMDDKMKTLLNKIKSEKKKNESIGKIKQLEIELVKIKYVNNPNKLQKVLNELNKIQVVNKNLHEIHKEILREYAGEFEMVGKLKVGDQIRETHIRFRKITKYESYIKAIDQDYEPEDAMFNGYFYKINTPHFNLIDTSQYGNGCDFKHKIVEYRGNICYIPTNGYCFGKCINFLTGKDHKKPYLHFIRS